MRLVTTEDCFPSEHYKFLCLNLGLPPVIPPTSTTGDESRDKSSCLRQINTYQWYLRPRQKLKIQLLTPKKEAQGPADLPGKLSVSSEGGKNSARAALWLWSFYFISRMSDAGDSEVSHWEAPIHLSASLKFHLCFVLLRCVPNCTTKMNSSPTIQARNLYSLLNW